ncbi:hypothetical protein [Rubellicoccus peritrichatus]|uniref:Pyrrolidone-carboxylate peptidase n=1 Tax=Rubellicoccus peritrichatus TaxID=3080537 RepID=A0AAQ3LEM6_9BACT|nr:hypothetical protein [Puniceicoccus sp. CR14]WOO42208.1 hypothetical protein RZN69_03840 [Puniceicoccus sp. CR14]
MSARALVYGFGPFQNYRHNVTSDIVAEINQTGLATGIVFDVRFDREMFEDAIKHHRPDIIIGMGQHPGAKKIRIERRAVNWRKDDQLNEQMIAENGPRYRYTSLKIPDDDLSTITYDAGTYVCNFSMYVMCEYSKRTGVPFAFLHVPFDVDPKRVVRYILNSV